MFSACVRQRRAMMTHELINLTMRNASRGSTLISWSGIKHLAIILGVACAVPVQVFTACSIQSIRVDNLSCHLPLISYTHHSLIYRFQAMQSDPKTFGTKMHGVLNGPQKNGTRVGGKKARFYAAYLVKWLLWNRKIKRRRSNKRKKGFHTYKSHICDWCEKISCGRCWIRLLLRSLQTKWKVILWERENQKGKAGHEY